MAAFAGSDYTKVSVGRANERANPRFGMDKGTRVHPGKIFINGKWLDEAEFFRVR